VNGRPGSAIATGGPSVNTGISSVQSFGRAFLGAVPPTLAASWIVLSSDTAPYAWPLLGGALVVSALFSWRAGNGLAPRLQTISDVLSAFREGDFSIRAHGEPGTGAIASVITELNRLGDTLRDHRLGELEVWMLLRKVMAEVDVVVLAFDARGHVKLANEQAAQVFRVPAEAIIDQPASSFGLDELLAGVGSRIIKDSVALGAGSWEMRRGAFRLLGEPHVLVVLSDVSGVLRQEELTAWKRLIRVMGHEINNSLAPIQSIAENLQTALSRPVRADDWEQDFKSGLSIVARRAEGLGRFIAGYSQLARLPPPVFGTIDVSAWAARSTRLETRLRVVIEGGPLVSLLGDADQLDQLLINLVKNAVDASLERSGGVRLSWSVSREQLHLHVDDEGPGAPESANLFVPFFTTKPGGSGIGLVLARQIAQAHGGDVSLATRPDGSGARALVLLPVGSDPGAHARDTVATRGRP
jgi:two-component system, NtrC family, nitrogen regulation sensor histidine kinase NtrY